MCDLSINIHTCAYTHTHGYLQCPQARACVASRPAASAQQEWTALRIGHHHTQLVCVYIYLSIYIYIYIQALIITHNIYKYKHCMHKYSTSQ